ncbi:hypothetical protein L345_00182 [Ophiophagus hannah]|uniref:Uncharacterized protein n=1 Tax=Ophiophagus hannah TaxID=8665 RepID=V8PHF3_OPHHA|nr:hypothetical protein L345_00182 [Ophiophagus hannah]
MMQKNFSYNVVECNFQIKNYVCMMLNTACKIMFLFKYIQHLSCRYLTSCLDNIHHIPCVMNMVNEMAPQTDTEFC